MNAEQRQMAADPWTKPTDLSHWPAFSQLWNYIHHRHHHYFLYFTYFPRTVRCTICTRDFNFRDTQHNITIVYWDTTIWIQKCSTSRREMTSGPPSWNYDVIQEIRLPQSMHIFLMNNPVKFYPDPIWDGRALRFLARDSIYAIARYMSSPVRLSVCLSVCLSVTRVDQSKTVEVRITQSSPQSSPMTLVSWRGTAPWNSNGNIGSGGDKYDRHMNKKAQLTQREARDSLGI